MTCYLGWLAQGIYPQEQDGTFISSVDRSNTTINQNSENNNIRDYFLLAAADDHGKVSLYGYPSLEKN